MTNRDMISDLIRHLDTGDEWEIGYAPEEVIAILNENISNWGLRNALKWDWVTKIADVGMYDFEPMSESVRSDFFRKLISSQIIQIGSCGNGDIVGVHFTEDKDTPVIVSHNSLFSDSAPITIAPMFGSLEELLWRLCEGRYVPRDYCTAVAFNEMLTNQQCPDAKRVKVDKL